MGFWGILSALCYREGRGLRRSCNYSGCFILSFICFTLIISSSLSAPSEIIHYHFPLPAGKNMGKPRQKQMLRLLKGRARSPLLINLARSWQAVIPSVDLTQPWSLLHCRDLGLPSRASVCCWARRHRGLGDHKTGGK